MPKTFQYPAWSKPLLPALRDATPSGVAEWAARPPEPPRPVRRLTPEPACPVWSVVTPTVTLPPTGHPAWAVQAADPPRRIPRLTPEPASLFVAWPVPAAPPPPPINAFTEWLVRGEELPHRVPRLIQDPASRYTPESIDSAPPPPTWDPRPIELIDAKPLRSGERAGGSFSVVAPLAPVPPRTEPTAAESGVWARGVDLPQSPRRAPQPPGVTAPDVSGDRPIYGWARRLGETPARPRPRFAGPQSDTTPLAYPRLPVAWNRPQEVPAGLRRRSQAGPVPDGPAKQSTPRFFASETVLPKTDRRRLPGEGVRPIPLVRLVPTFFGAETVTPTFRRRISHPPGHPFVVPRHATPVYVPVPMAHPVPPRRRVIALPAEGRFDSGGPAVPPLVWFVAHELPRRLQARWAYEYPLGPMDPGLDLLKPDDRDATDGEPNAGQGVTGG